MRPSQRRHLISPQLINRRERPTYGILNLPTSELFHFLKGSRAALHNDKVLPNITTRTHGKVSSFLFVIVYVHESTMYLCVWHITQHCGAYIQPTPNEL